MIFTNDARTGAAEPSIDKNQCCNYDNGNCILLDDGEPCVCPQSISYSLNCKWFRTAVLPNDKELYIKLMKPKNRKNVRFAVMNIRRQGAIQNIVINAAERYDCVKTLNGKEISGLCPHFKGIKPHKIKCFKA